MDVGDYMYNKGLPFNEAMLRVFGSPEESHSHAATAVAEHTGNIWLSLCL